MGASPDQIFHTGLDEFSIARGRCFPWATGAKLIACDQRPIVVCTRTTYLADILVQNIGKDGVNVADVIQVLPSSVQLLLVML